MRNLLLGTLFLRKNRSVNHKLRIYYFFDLKLKHLVKKYVFLDNNQKKMRTV